MTNFDKINILLIEDNPGQFGLPVDSFNAREGNEIFNPNLHKCNIPTVDFDTLDADYKQFNLKVLQHPVEVKEFIDLYSDTLNAFGEVEVGKLKGIVPDLIVFDYAFGENIETNKDNKTGNIHYSEEYDPIRHFINPNVKLQKKLKTIISSPILQLEANNNYTENEFFADLNFLKSTSFGGDDENSLTNLNKEIIQNDKAIISDDQIGLFSGLSIYSMFRNHHTIAIPATHNATEIKKMNFYAKYLEWLYRTEMHSVFDEEVRGHKTWDSIIPKAMQNFRQKIISLASKYAITFSLENLYQLANLKSIDQLEILGLQIHSKYGTKNYSIKTLFVDVTESIVDKVKNYASGLIKIFQVSSSEYKIVVVNYLKIWNTYVEHFQNIYLLSEYVLKYRYLLPGFEYMTLDSAIDAKQKLEEEIVGIDDIDDRFREKYNQLFMITKYIDDFDLFTKLKSQYVNPNTKGFKEEVSVFNLDLEAASKKKIIILLITKLYLQFLKANNNAKLKQFISEPMPDEYAYVLSPIRSEYTGNESKNLLLLETHRIALPNANEYGLNITKLRKTNRNLHTTLANNEYDNLKCWDFTDFSPVDKQFAISFFSNELNKYKTEQWPHWLK